MGQRARKSPKRVCVLKRTRPGGHHSGGRRQPEDIKEMQGPWHQHLNVKELLKERVGRILRQTNF